MKVYLVWKFHDYYSEPTEETLLGVFSSIDKANSKVSEVHTSDYPGGILTEHEDGSLSLYSGGQGVTNTVFISTVEVQ